MRKRQRAFALYSIGKLALRAGNERDVDQADTLDRCSSRVELYDLHKQLNGKKMMYFLIFLAQLRIWQFGTIQREHNMECLFI